MRHAPEGCAPYSRLVCDMLRILQAQKWQNAMVVGGGRICIAAPRSGVMTTLQSHVQDWGTERGKKPRLYLTNFEWLRNCKSSDSPWARIR